jgi:vancomycin permeability regulator SanA
MIGSGGGRRAEPRAARRRRRRAFGALLALVGAYLVAAVALALAGSHDRTAHADVIVVPGNTVAPDGTPGPRLRARLDAALWLYRRGDARLIFVSGGTGVEGFDEAEAMARYLVGQGVPAADVVRDPAGLDTDATARNLATYLGEHRLRTALVATQFFHVPRTELALGRHGVEVVGSRHARYVEWRDVYSLAREVVAYPTYAIGSG